MRIKEYKTVNGQTPVVLDSKVNEMLKQGYDLFGPPYAVATNTLLTFFQAMVLKEQEIDQPPS